MLRHDSTCYRWTKLTTESPAVDQHAHWRKILRDIKVTTGRLEYKVTTLFHINLGFEAKKGWAGGGKNPSANDRNKGTFLRSVKSEADEALKCNIMGLLSAKKRYTVSKPIVLSHYPYSMLITCNITGSSGGVCRW